MIQQQTAQVCAYIAAANPQWRATKETIHVYHDLLLDLEFDQVMHALKQILKTADWVPTPAQIRRTLYEIEGVLAPSRGSAWAEIMSGIRNTPSNERPQWSHEIIGKAVDTIGLYQIRTSTNLDTLRAQFWKVYDELVIEYDRAVILSGSAHEIERNHRLELR